MSENDNELAEMRQIENGVFDSEYDIPPFKNSSVNLGEFSCYEDFYEAI